MRHHQEYYRTPFLSVVGLAFYLDRISPRSLLRISSVLLSLLIVGSALGQEEKKLAEPAVASVPYFLAASGELVALESRVVRFERKYHSLGFKGGTNLFLVEGEKSPVRIMAEGKLEFVVRLDGHLDPLETIQFYRFDRSEGSRVAPIDDFDGLGRASKYKLLPATVDFNAAKYGTSSFKVIPIRPLVPGEYCLVVKVGTRWQNSSPAFCFGLDRSASLDLLPDDLRMRENAAFVEREDNDARFDDAATSLSGFGLGAGAGR